MTTSHKLPFLPGYSITTDKRNRFHKPHFFEVSNGTRIDHSQQLNINQAATQNIITNSTQHPLLVTPTLHAQSEYATAHSSPNDHVPLDKSLASSMSRLPNWVAYDRKVLRFYGYFKEAVHSSPIENWRVRKCVLYLYLEDESIHITEPKIENSGIPQGVFVKRHRIPNAQTNTLYGVKDLSVGKDILVYGRVFHLVDADPFTRDFYAANGLGQLNAPEAYPVDPFTSKSPSYTQQPNHHKTMHPHKLYLEAALGKPMLPSAAQTQQFLANDGQVLRFYAQWDDDKLYGEKKPYIIHYYLADDTLEVNEIQTPNNGRDPFPTLLKRGRLPKDWQATRPTVAKLGLSHHNNHNNEDELDVVAGGGTPQPFHEKFYTLLDFRIGNTINVYGRPLLICSLDLFTKKYYQQHFGLTDEDFTPINMSDPEDEIATLTPPPYNGYGTEEDSLGSFLFLMPKIPKTNFKKLMEYDGIHLRYLARLLPSPSANAATRRADEQRKFIITFYCANDQLSIFEKFERNSGFLGGKFLEKCRLKNPRTGQWFTYSDFVNGAQIVVNEYVFEILEADEFTVKWMKKQQQLEQSNNNNKQPEEEKTQY